MLDVVGIPAAGWVELTPRSQKLVARARLIYGSPRQLDLLPSEIRAERRRWPSPLRGAFAPLFREAQEVPVVVLASGDPLLSGIGTTLVEQFGANVVRIHPAVSSVSLARARMGWSAERCDVVTLVGRDHDQLRRWLAPGAQLVVLSADDRTPARLLDILREEGYAASMVTILSDLGTEHERRTDLRGHGSVPSTISALNLVCIACRGDAAEPRSLSPGLPTDTFDHDGQITKPLLRAAALSALAPLTGETLWDLGAGCGSVAIEWCRLHPRNGAVAVERDPARAERIRHNASRLGVAPQLEIIESDVHDFVGAELRVPRHATCAEPAVPEAVFCGGGLNAELVDSLVANAQRGTRIVAHAVTVESEAVLLAAYRSYGGLLHRIGVETAEELGSRVGFAPARTITQWSVRVDR